MFSGCSGILPDNGFTELVYKLDMPVKISEWLTENITYKANLIIQLTPYQLYKSREGDCSDMSGFGEFIADYHGYTTWEIKIWYSDTQTTHKIVVYQEEKLSYMDNWLYVYGFDTFLEIVWDDDRMNQYNWESYRVYDYENNIIERGIR